MSTTTRGTQILPGGAHPEVPVPRVPATQMGLQKVRGWSSPFYQWPHFPETLDSHENGQSGLFWGIEVQIMPGSVTQEPPPG